MDTLIASPDAANLADAVMPDNGVESVTQQLQQQEQAQEAAPTPYQQPAEQPQNVVEQAPVSYNLQVPEGYFLSDDMKAEFTQMAQGLGLTNDAVNRLVQFHVKQMEASQREQASTQADRAAAYEKLSRQDAEIGGARFEATLKAAKTALNQYGTAALAQVLDESGLGNHPEMIRLFAKIGAAMGEGHYAGGKEVVSERPKTRAEVLYG